MPSDLIPYKEWLKRTSVLGKPRSKLLKALDDELRQYETSPGGGAAMWHIEQKLKAWQEDKGPGDMWRKNPRNKKDFAFEQLQTLLTKKSPEAGSMPAYLAADMDNARLGVLYLFGHTEVSSNIFNVILSGGLSVAGSALSYAGSPAGGGNAAASSAATNLGTAMVPGSALLDAAETGVWTASGSNDVQMHKRFLAWLEDFAKKVLDAMKEKFGSVDLTLSAIKNLLKVLAGVFMKNAAPFISAGLDIFKGLANTADATVRKLKSWSQGKGVEILPGHPSVIIDAIKKAMTLSLFEGLYQTLKGVGGVGLEFLTGAAATVINIVVAISETIITVIWRLVEIARMKKFFGEAKEHWETRDSIGFHKDYISFNRWYKEYALGTPALAILTLNSGICGDKMRYLRMYKADDTVVTQGEFTKGVVYLDGMKANGAKLLSGCGFNFGSNDKAVEGYLNLAKSHDRSGSTVWGHVLKFANA
jgi:hypothetical protein